MEIPGLGAVTEDAELGWHVSEPIAVPVLGGQPCRIVVEDYEDDERQDEFHAAIASFLSIGPSVLEEAAPPLFRYYQDEAAARDADGDEELPVIASPGEVWRHVRFRDEAVVSRRAYGDFGIYVSVEGECDWEEEHGLQVVFKGGARVNKVGPYDGHLSNADAYDDNRLEDVVYRPRG